MVSLPMTRFDYLSYYHDLVITDLVVVKQCKTKIKSIILQPLSCALINMHAIKLFTSITSTTMPIDRAH